MKDLKEASEFDLISSKIGPSDTPNRVANTPIADSSTSVHGGSGGTDRSDRYHRSTKSLSWKEGSSDADHNLRTGSPGGATDDPVKRRFSGRSRADLGDIIDGSDRVGEAVSLHHLASRSTTSSVKSAEPEEDDPNSWKTGWLRPQTAQTLRRPRLRPVMGWPEKPESGASASEMDVSSDDQGDRGDGDEGDEGDEDEIESEDEDEVAVTVTAEVKGKAKGKAKAKGRGSSGNRVACLKGCGMTFARYAEARRHSEQTAGCGGGEKAFVCERCGSSFTRSDALSRHARPRGRGKVTSCDTKYETLMRQKASSHK